MEGEGEGHGAEQVGVHPRGHREQRLVLRDRVEGVGHLDGDQHGESHRHRLGRLGEG